MNGFVQPKPVAPGLSCCLLAVAPLAWLVPNHYFPWPSAWLEAVAMAALAGGALLTVHHGRSSQPLWLWCALAIGAVGLQWALGKVAFAGDVWMFAFYAAAFAAAVSVGRSSLDAPSPLALFLLSIALAAALSVGLASAQWTGAVRAWWIADLPPGTRPFGNVAQPNHLCTVAFLGLCSLLALRQLGRIGTATLMTGALWLVFGMVMSASRTGWLQVAWLVALACFMHFRRARLVDPRPVVAVALVFALLVALWPAINDAMLLSSGRTLAEAAQSGTRLAHWASMVDAMSRSPWTGYGFYGVNLAQQTVALDHPPVGEHIEHAHNVLLDLLVWFGIPVGGLLIVTGSWALVRVFLRCRDARAVWLLAGVGGVLIHGLLEYPLSYAYFLIPMGLLLGAAMSLQQGEAGPAASPWPLRAAGAVLGAMLAVTAFDYIRAEENMRTLRMETARIGTSSVTSLAPDLLVLDQLEGLLRFARTEARPGMPQSDVETMRRMSERMGYPSVMMRYALAAGLNGDAATARLTLDRLCRIHTAPRCEEAREAWASATTRWPVLQAVALPELQVTQR